MQDTQERQCLSRVAPGMLLLASLLMLSACGANYDNLAKCLTDNGARMYGTFWCSHCKAQKQAFGSSFEFINYVECDPRGNDAKPSECAVAGVKGYPTWQINSKLYVGAQPLERLAELSGCSIS